tara:strand:- start:1141 stop:1308 length:168 start_codon:yes stop_codon:yes gene_type:complete
MVNKHNTPELNNFSVCFDKQNNFRMFVKNKVTLKNKRVLKDNKNKLQVQETFFTN